MEKCVHNKNGICIIGNQDKPDFCDELCEEYEPLSGDAVLCDERRTEDGVILLLSLDIDCRTYELFKDLLEYVVKQGYSVTTERDYKIKAEKHVPLFA